MSKPPYRMCSDGYQEPTRKPTTASLRAYQLTQSVYYLTRILGQQVVCARVVTPGRGSLR